MITPNIIVLDRIRTDFDGLRIFFEDPVLPPNGYSGGFDELVVLNDEAHHIHDPQAEFQERGYSAWKAHPLTLGTSKVSTEGALI
ncbi:MAG: hypothetical protein DRH21_02955 [Deltaproteobacteria bacterium]|nr:MAG: hypothetical protein DRH21_02955 [Deltaproteobacteria bacterium]